MNVKKWTGDLTQLHLCLDGFYYCVKSGGVYPLAAFLFYEQAEAYAKTYECDIYII